MKPKKNKIKKLKRYHKWPALIISFILIYYAVSGILMNHRKLISGMDVSRKLLPKNYKYNNWNQAALKGNRQLSKDSILLYGNIGVWLTDSTYSEFIDFNNGFPKGMDNRKIFDLHISSNGNLYAATLFGLYSFNSELEQWQKFSLDVDIERFVSVLSHDDWIIAMNRSYVFRAFDQGVDSKFEKLELKAPSGYKNDVGLFETMWQIHSGEIFGLPGKLFVDFMGILVLALSVTGIIYFFFPRIIKRRKRKQKQVFRLVSLNKFSLKWHNKIGAWFIVFLVLLALTGMFLRPPLLIPIANARIPAIKFTHLDQPNPWYDDLRDLIYNEENGQYILAGYNGLYYLKTLESVPVLCNSQPPVSVMGINVFEKFNEQSYLIGSFSGLFLWNPDGNAVYDFISGKPYRGATRGMPFGSYAVTGILEFNHKYQIIDYNQGILSLGNAEHFLEMPEIILDNSPMSLWNLSLEIHTGRIFEFLLSSFYILLVPVVGIISIIVIISGYLIWRKRKRKKYSTV